MTVIAIDLGGTIASVVVGPIVDRNGYKGMLLLALAIIAVGSRGSRSRRPWRGCAPRSR